MAPSYDGEVMGLMLKRLLTSTGVRLLVLLLFFGVCAGLTWSDTARGDHYSHSHRYSHIEKLDRGSFDVEERIVKQLCPAITDAPPSLHYLPHLSALTIPERYLLQVDLPSVPSGSRAPPLYY